MADFPSYIETQQRIDTEYLDGSIWWRKSILNVARIGKFSSDRTVLEYARDIWRIGQYEKSGHAKTPPRLPVAAVVKANGEAAAVAETVPESRSPAR